MHEPIASGTRRQKGKHLDNVLVDWCVGEPLELGEVRLEVQDARIPEHHCAEFCKARIVFLNDALEPACAVSPALASACNLVLKYIDVCRAQQSLRYIIWQASHALLGGNAVQWSTS